jgi:predicted phosphodiesterase
MAKAQNKAKKQDEVSADVIAKDIQYVADNMGIDPWAVSLVQYRKNGGKFSERKIRYNGGFVSIKNTYFGVQEPKDYATISDLKELRSQYNKLLVEAGDVERLHRRIQESLSKMPKITGTVYTPKKKQQKTTRTVNLVLSDLHIGSDLSAKESVTQFGRVEESRALAAVIKNTCEYKQQYRAETELNVLLLGDIFEAELHDRTSADLLHVQTCRAIYLLIQAVKRLAENFPKVTIYTAVGNHGRDTAVHKQRATALKFNALETTVYFAIKQACAGLKNVKFEQSMHPWTIVKSQGYSFFATHGDTVFNVGNVGNSVNIKSLENQINKINASLKDSHEYRVFVVGHVHQAMVTQISNGTTVIVNGALTPPNGYANSLGIMESQQIQVLWETVPGFPVGDFRFIDVSDSATKESLDSIITPFSEFVL